MITAIRQERFADAAELLRRWPREAFPPVWTLWPHAAPYADPAEAILPVTGMLREELPEWARLRYERHLFWVLALAYPERSPQVERIARELEQIHFISELGHHLEAHAKGLRKTLHNQREEP